MFALVDTLNARDCSLLLGRVKMTIAGALLVRADGHTLLTKLEELVGNDCNGPALSGDAPVALMAVRSAVTDWAFGQVSATTALERIADALR
jgi:hypothetical protein